jgi:hypothetical protein
MRQRGLIIFILFFISLLAYGQESNNGSATENYLADQKILKELDILFGTTKDSRNKFQNGGEIFFQNQAMSK